MSYQRRDVILVSSDPSQVIANHNCRHPAISADGHKVAFRCSATNLIPSDENGVEDIFVKNIDTAAVIRASADASGKGADGASQDPDISVDGRFVVFASLASNLAPGASGMVMNIYEKDTISNEVKLASSSGTGTEGNAASANAAVSADGRYVVFASEASNLVDGDTNASLDIFRKDTQTGVVSRISVNSAEQEGNGPSGSLYGPSISADGRYVAFSSRSSNLHPQDTDTNEDLFIKDMLSGIISLASTNGEGVKGNGNSVFPVLSADGQMIAFRSTATNLSPADGDPGSDVYLKDMASGRLVLVSADASGQKANRDSWDPFLSPDGGTVAFSSDATNLTAGTVQPVYQIFLKNISDGSVILASVSPDGSAGNGTSISPALSRDGRMVVYESESTNIAGTIAGPYQVFMTIFEPIGTPAGCAS